MKTSLLFSVACLLFFYETETCYSVSPDDTGSSQTVQAVIQTEKINSTISHLTDPAVTCELPHTDHTNLSSHEDFISQANKLKEKGLLELSKKGVTYWYPPESVNKNLFVRCGIPPEDQDTLMANISKAKKNRSNVRLFFHTGTNHQEAMLEIKGNSGAFLTLLNPTTQDAPSGYRAREYEFDIKVQSENAGKILMKERIHDLRPEAYLAKIDVNANYQNQGLGTKAIMGLTTFYDQLPSGISKMTLAVASAVPSAALIYAKAGFSLNEEAVSRVAEQIGKPKTWVRAQFLKDSTGQSLLAKQALVDLPKEVLKIGEMERVRGAPIMQISSKSTPEDIEAAYRLARGISDE